MAEFIANQFTRITSASTWTEVAGATKGLSGFASGDVAELDVLIQNWVANNNTVEVAITATSSAPSANTESLKRVLAAAESSGDYFQVQIILTGTEHLWVKSDQTDTRVTISGTKEDN